MKRYFSAHRPFRKGPGLSSQKSRVCPEAEGPEPVEEIERTACPRFHPADMPKIPRKRQKHPHFYSFLPTRKFSAIRISATQPATNPFPPAKINVKSQKVCKNDPIAGISSPAAEQNSLPITNLEISFSIHRQRRNPERNP